jgi:aerobic carbon-monoxide dehydrogenase medium subunit
MKPAPFEYHAPRELKAAAALLASLPNAKILAGGQSLVPMLNFRYVMVDHLIDLGGVADLRGIAVSEGRLRIGAMTRQRDLETAPEIKQHCPLLAEALRHVGHRQTRNRGTIGGSLAHADPAAELPAVCAAYGALIHIASIRGLRQVAFPEFATGFMATALAPDEMIAAIDLPIWRQGHGYGFQEFARRRGDFALAGAAALLDIGAGGVVRRAAVSLCGVGPTPVRLEAAEATLVGQPIDASLIRSAAAAAWLVEPISDIHAGAEYRRHLAQVLSTRALTDAARRAGVDVPNLV